MSPIEKETISFFKSKGWLFKESKGKTCLYRGNNHGEVYSDFELLNKHAEMLKNKNGTKPFIVGGDNESEFILSRIPWCPEFNYQNWRRRSRYHDLYRYIHIIHNLFQIN